MSRFPYQFFNEFVIRTPFFSHKKFQQTISSKNEITDSELKEICTNLIFQEAIYLASPYLYNELAKWINSEKHFLPKDYQTLKHTILKYYSRMSTRCTPFGLFSGVSLGEFNEEITNKQFVNNPNQTKAGQLIRDTKLDMRFLVSLAQHFMQLPEIRSKLLLFPNNSIYTLGNKIRYVEYQYTGGKRDYIISSAPLSIELQQILELSKEGKTLQQLAETLIDNEITQEEALEFIEELIDNQVLISELEPNVSGKDFLEVIISVLQRIKAEKEMHILISVKNKLTELDQNIGNPVSKYAEIEGLIKSFDTEYEQKYLFQTDLYSESQCVLPNYWKKEIKKGISFLNKINKIQKNNHLKKFKKAFNERFETQEMPLLYVLDAEVGIGYKQDAFTKGLHSYLEDLQLSISKKDQNLHIELSPVYTILNEKLQNALLENQYKIELSDRDFKDFEENWDDLPDTISFLTEIISENKQEKLFLNNSTGSSSANLLGRFCSERSDVQNLSKIITEKEEELNSDCILAEIIHLPEARIGNVIRRPTLRQYEIPYLAQSVLPKENQISVNDLYISLKNERIVLRSKKLNKEVKPYLTNAHNYSSNTLPVYHFLSDLYSQDIRDGLYFTWGGLEHIYKFLPRIEYKNIIISKAQWKVTDKDVVLLEEIISDKDYFLNELSEWREKRKIPALIQWADWDNTLTLNLENYDIARLFVETVKKKKSITIEEFLFNENDDFRREFIFSIYKSERL
ncbi:lantibiotic dehydratase [Chryseobacterium elymi]|uniref:Lantibiotic dehydratase n=1 Tax=Chryseobacterium elymi TaxID=395936 RepID=A0A3D9DGM8_9FLAO|nr:lantibiotic dehydratase family protein [Chryseobacterium elymi]REC77116.1 lantibiotic dehydratase [Chryseobacterium elymi]